MWVFYVFKYEWGRGVIPELQFIASQSFLKLYPYFGFYSNGDAQVSFMMGTLLQAQGV